jgi:putative transposase
MSRNYYSEIHLHLVWHTKSSLPHLTTGIEKETHSAIRSKLVRTPGVFVHELGGTETHVHVSVTITPTVLVSDLVGQAKGASAHAVNQKLGAGRKVIEWQAGYGVVSFGSKDLEWVKAYVRNQREHHARGSTYDRLESIVTVEAGAQADREAP